MTQSTLAVSKPPMLALLTNVGHGSDVTWNVPNAGYKGKEKLIDILTCTSVTADKHGGVIVHGTSGNPQVRLSLSWNSTLSVFVRSRRTIGVVCRSSCRRLR